MNRLLKRGIVFLGIMALCGSLAEAKVYATVNGENITEKDFEIFEQSIPGFDIEKIPANERTNLINGIIDRKLILKSAQSKRYDSQKEYKDTIQAIQENILIEFWSKKMVETSKVGKLSDADVRKIYNETKDRFVDQTGKARHILVKTEAEARAILAELNKVRGNVEAKFIDLANTKSIDTNTQSQKNGGDLGTFNRVQMVPEFSKAAFALKPKTYTKTPVKTEFGYHIIYLESKSDPKTINYQQAKAILEQEHAARGANDVLTKEVQKLRSAAKISIK